MKRKISLAISLLIVFSLVLLSLASCGSCTHRDADDDSLCDNCGEDYTDGCDNHRDADDNGICDNGGEDYTDGIEPTETVTVSFNSLGGSAVTAITVDKNGKLTAPTAPTKNGYVFDGWYLGGDIWDFENDTVSESITLTARWTAESYEIVINLVGGSGTYPPSYTVEDGITLADPTRNGYTFEGWTFEGALEPVKGLTIPLGTTGNKEFTATWKTVDFYISITLCGGSFGTGVTVPTTYNVESDTVIIPNPTREGYVFDGWTFEGADSAVKDLTLPTGSLGNRELTATWSPVKFSIEIDLAGGSFGEDVEIPTTYDVESDTITISAPSRLGYEFEGWSVDGSDDKLMEVVISAGSVGDKTISANWKIINYEISIDTTDGDEIVLPTPTYTINTSDITIPTPQKRGYTFTGWLVNDSTEPVMTYVIRQGSYGHLKLVATWELTRFTVSYKNTLDAANSNPEYYYVTSNTITLSALTKSGYIFGGWYLNGTLVKEIPAGSVGNLTLTARWTEDIKASQGLSMTQNGNSYTVSGIGSCTDTEIVIPLMYNNKPVTAIANNAFKNNTKITKVYITGNITSIGQQAFYGCSKLTEIIIGEGVTSIANYAFYNCTSLTKIAFNALNCSNLSSSNYAFGYAGKNGNGITVTFGAGVTRVPAYIFYPYSSTGYEPKITGISFADDSSCTEIGTYAFYNLKTLLSINLPESLITIGNGMLCGCTGISSLTIPSSVTTIGGSAFASCTGLISVTIPENVKTIGNSAFNGCTNLTLINFNARNATDLSSGNYVFANAGTASTGITVRIGKNVERLPAYIFSPYSGSSYSANITSVVFADNGALTEIGNRAFYYSKYLTSITIPESVKTIGSYAFAYSSALSSVRFEGGEVINSYAFAYSSALKQVVFAGGVKEIGSYAFQSCSALSEVHATSLIAWCSISFYDYYANPLYFAKNLYVNGAPLSDILIPEGVESIGNYVFYGFEGATKLSLPSTLKTIGKYAFGYCRGLEDVSLGGVENIGDYAFIYCTGIKELIIPASVATVGNSAFSSCNIDKVICLDLAAWCSINFNGGSANPATSSGKLYLNNTLITNLVIPDSVSAIGGYTFYKNTAITSVDLGNAERIGSYTFAECTNILSLDLKSVKVLDNYAFYKCSGIVTIDLGEVESIGSYAFWSASGITSLTLPDSLKIVNTYTFSGLSSLAYLDIGKGVTTIYSYGFYSCPKLETLVIPDNVTSLSSYAFRECTSLKSISIGKGLTTLESRVFSGCTHVTEIYYNAISCNATRSAEYIFEQVGRYGEGVKVTIGKDVERIPDKLFYVNSNSDMYYPSIVSLEFEDNSSCTAIGQYAFANLYKLVSMELPQGLVNIGNYAFYCDNKITALVIPDSVESVGNYAFGSCNGIKTLTIGKSVKTIGTYAFSYFAGVEEIIIPDGVTEIPAYAFYDCRNATKITLPKSLKTIGSSAFFGAGIAVITLPETVTSIGDQAFANSALTTINIPDSVTGLGQSAFKNCKSLTEISVGSGVTAIQSSTFMNCAVLAKITLKGTLTSIGESAFQGCAALTEIALGNEITNIGQKAFQSCSSLLTFTIPAKVTSIANYLFDGCASLSSIVIHDSVTSIGQYAFQNCSALKSLTIGKSVVSISNYAFYGCTALEALNFNATAATNFSNNNYVFANAGTEGRGIAVVFGAEVTKVPSYLFAAYNSNTLQNAPKLYSVTFEGTSCKTVGQYAFAYTRGLKSITLPAGATLETYVFTYAVDLEEVTLPTGITAIPDFLFNYCESLKSVKGTDAITKIGNSSFRYCRSLTEYNFREGITSISQYAFYGCESLKSVTLPSTLTSLSTSTFYDCRGLEELNFNITNTISFSSGNYIFAYAGLDGAGLTVNIGKDVTAIPNYIFSPYSSRYNEVSEYTPKIVAVNFADESKLISIGQYSFAHNEYLMSITLPASLNSIGSYAFYGCTKLIEVKNLSASLTVNKDSSNGYVGYYAKNVINGEGNSIIKNYNGLLYYVDASTNTCVVVGCDDELTELRLPDTIEGLSYTIRNGAFKGNGTITKIVFAEGITSIGASAYYGCVGLTEVVIPDSVTSIGASAFYGCTGLKTLTIGSGVTYIGTNAFKNCKSLTAINYNAVNCQSLTQYGYAFDNAGISGDGITVVIGKDVTAIPDYLFHTANNSTAPKTIAIVFEDGSACTSIGTRAFSYNTYLKEITIPENVTSIAGSAFVNCTSVTTLYFNAKSLADLSNRNLVFSSLGVNTDGVTVIFGDGITRIPSYLFYPYDGNSQYTPKIISIVLPASVKTVGQYAFAALPSLSTVKLNSAISFEKCAFENSTNITELHVASLSAWLECSFADTHTPFRNSAKFFVAGEELTGELVIPEGITAIPDYAFYGAQGISKVVFPESLTSVGAYAFYKTGITELTLGGNIDTIGDYAFYYCPTLASITIGSNVKNIGEYAFAGCYLLAEIFYNSEVCTTVDSNGGLFNGSGRDVEGGITVTIGKNVTRIPNYFFYLRTTNTIPTFKDIVFEEGTQLTTIGAYSFYNCTGLTSITLPTSVKTIGSYAFHNCTNLTGITLHEGITDIYSYAFENAGITEIVIPNSVSMLDSYAFSGCTSLTKVTIGKGITRFGTYVFNGTTALTNIVYSVENTEDLYNAENIFLGAGNTTDGVTVIIAKSVTHVSASLFYSSNTSNAMKVVAVVFEDGSQCRSIGYNAFCGNAYITEITLPDGLETIGASAFKDCTALTKLSVPDTLVNISADTLSGCTALEYTVYEGVKYLGNENNPYVIAVGAVDKTTLSILKLHEGTRVIASSAFASCKALESVVLGDKVVTISSDAFSGCSALESVILGKSLRIIGERAFAGCSALISIEISASVTEIFDYAFSECTALTEIIINADFTHGYQVFYNAGTAGNGVTVTFGKDVTTVPAGYFYYNGSGTPKITGIIFTDGGSCVSIASSAFKALTALKTVKLPDTLTHIGSYSFEMCRALSSLTVPASVTAIENYAFSGCTELASIEFENGLESIGQYAFSGCVGLTSISIPNSVTSIGGHAFAGCSSVESVTLPFTGQTPVSTSNSHLGHIFGTSEFTNSYRVQTGTSSSSKTYYLPSTLVSVTVNGGNLAKSFYGCSSIKEITIGANVASIAEGEFERCTSLITVNYNAINIEALPFGNGMFYNAGTEGVGITVTIGSSVKRIPSYMFISASRVNNVVFTGNALESIGNNAFDNFNITEITLPESVKNIEASAFKNCKALLSITLPSGVKAIGDYAFSGCDMLATVNAVGVTEIGNFAFENCKSLTAIELSGSLTSIGDGAFYGCVKLTEFDGGNALISIGDQAFYNCTNLKTVTLPNTLLNIGTYAFASCKSIETLHIPGSVKLIPDYAFSASSISALTLGLGIEYIGNYAFFEATVKNLVIPDSVTTIGNSAFARSNPTGLVLGKGVTTIGASAFESSKITSISIPTGVSVIAQSTFAYCEELVNVTLHDTITEIQRRAFYNCKALAEIKLPSSLTTLGESAYYGCSAATGSIVIPDGLTVIDNYTFCNCKSITAVTFGSSLTNIGNSAFKECKSIVEIDIPANVTYIGWDAFALSTALTTVTIGEGVEYIGQRAFEGCSALASAIFKDTSTWWPGTPHAAGVWSIGTSTAADRSKMAKYLTNTYVNVGWSKE